ncbi:MAG TPA: hypothetical protein VGL54_02120 [Solirubrobacteraceae bacterium]
MNTTASPLQSAARQATGSQTSSPAHPRRDSGRGGSRLLGRYLDSDARRRQIVALPGARGSVLVVDRDASTLGDRRLVAHLAADEPPENAILVCRHYLRDTAGHWCRRVTAEDLLAVPFGEAEEQDPDPEARATVRPTALTDRQGRTYRLELCTTDMSIPELRWHRCSPTEEGAVPVVMREVIASLESYEPARTLTARALVLHRADPEVSTAMLRTEQARVERSEIVLNRGLRRAALAAAATQDLSMSEIAMRCGKIRCDSRGKASGETSWLARRLGISPEGGRDTPTPWIHTDVLALIARHGLGISPREVELG